MSARMLVVDDEAAVRATVAMLLRALAYEVTEAADGEAALAALERERFDVVLLDLRMPGMSGMETWAQMNALPGPPPVTVLLTAALEGPRLAAEHRLLYLPKPFGFDALLRVLDEALARSAPR